MQLLFKIIRARHNEKLDDFIKVSFFQIISYFVILRGGGALIYIPGLLVVNSNIALALYSRSGCSPLIRFHGYVLTRRFGWPECPAATLLHKNAFNDILDDFLLWLATRPFVVPRYYVETLFVQIKLIRYLVYLNDDDDFECNNPLHHHHHVNKSMIILCHLRTRISTFCIR